ncbi:DUF6894 family protein [Methylobacterium dankookense]|uniref:DUF6894 family protein n=1 Tax=Methylobacterium dankookense TaxID=560405 RepID=UPI0011A0B85F|nr:hypothetical protein [Methylobacterium dankookense]
MPSFYVDLRAPGWAEPNDIPIEFDSLEAAYLDACASIPGVINDLLSEKRDLTGCAFEIRAGTGELLMKVPFTEPVPWRPRPAAGVDTPRAVKPSPQPEFREAHSTPEAVSHLVEALEAQCRALQMQIEVQRDLDAQARSRSVEALARSYELLRVPVYRLFGEIASKS